MMRLSTYSIAMGAAGAMPSQELLEEYSQFFRLLSEPARLQLLCHLKQGPSDVASLIEATGFSQSHISRQLGQLQRAGLVRCVGSEPAQTEASGAAGSAPVGVDGPFSVRNA